MAMRRPRIKAVANIQLNAKRKPKTTNDVKPIKNSESDIAVQEEDRKEIGIENQAQQSIVDVNTNGQIEKEVRTENASDTNANQNINNNGENAKGDNKIEDSSKEILEEKKASKNIESNAKDVSERNKDSLNDSDAFKCPPRVGYQRTISHTSNSGADDVFYSDIEENAMQMDLQKSPNGFPMSPSKNQTRQRIRPTPHFGQRRNSFVGSSPSPHTSGYDDNQGNISGNNELNQTVQTTRRERHHSASLSGNSSSTTSSHHHYHTPHKYLPTIANIGTGRIRTESGCSVFSDTNTSSHKSRKSDEHNHRQNSRREFESRFINGVPDKSALKMSDLIYWNPATNPMEQKPNPNLKIEATDSLSSSDVKLAVEKKEKGSEEKSAEAEDIPVPQLKLNSNGELILDDKSLVIETTAEQEARKVLANSSLIYLDENTGMNGFYSRQKRTREWPSAETIKFYRCLQNVGTDFSLMVSLFPNRTRRDLKLKFKKEERINGHLINKALLYPKQFNIEVLKQQVEEEEKAREEEAKIAKITKNKGKKKKKICTVSVSNRILAQNDIYQNENTQKPKKTRKVNSKNNAKTEKSDQTSEQITVEDDISTSNNNNNINNNTDNDNNNIINEDIKIEKDSGGDKIKRRRRRTPNIATQKDEVIIIKEEVVKKEKKPETSNFTIITETAPIQYNDVKQLESEINELLQTSEVNVHNNSETMDATESSFMPITEAGQEDEGEEGNEQENEQEYEHEQMEEDSTTTSTDSAQFVIDESTNYYEQDMDIDEYDSRTIVNLDDGSVNKYCDLVEPKTISSSTLQYEELQPPLRSPTPPYEENKTAFLITSPPTPPRPPSPCQQPDFINIEDTCSSVISDRSLNEQDIQQILTELAEGSLVLVSSLDPEDPDKVLNEIYMVDKNTGDLCDEPLNIPDNIVQCILSVMS